MSDRFLNQTGLAHLVSKLKTMISGKVDKEEGKALSSNDFTDSYIDTIEDLSSSIEFNKTIYVDSVNGDDSNAGTSTSKYKTIEKALKEAIKYRTCIINLADGTYDTSAALDIRGSVSLSIRGSSADAVIINGRISAGRDAYVAFQNLTIQGEATTSNGAIFCWENAQIYTSGCNLIPTGGYCVYATTGGIVNLVSSTFGGTPTSTLRSQNGGTITAHGCTNNTGKSSSAVGSGRLYLNNCADMTYSNSTNGMVYVNGIQVLPTQDFIDDSGVTAGTYGPTTSPEPNFGDTFTIGPVVTVNEKGQITSAANAEAKLPNYTATTSKAGLMSASDKISLSNATTKISQLGTYYRSIYVSSTTGNDENDGSNGSPVATMARVRELVNTYQNSLISITFTDNAEYSYDGTLTFYARNIRFTGTATSGVSTTFTFSCSFEECNVSMSNIAFNYIGTSSSLCPLLEV